MLPDREPEFKSTIEEDTLVNDKRKLKCAQCERSTNHRIVKSLRDRWHSDDIGITGHTDFLIVECLGCDAYSFCRENGDSETYHEEISSDGASTELVYYTRIEQFPATNFTVKKHRKYRSMPLEVKIAFDETYNALCAGYSKLGAAGTRLIIESICLLNGVTGGNLQNKIEKLHEKGIVTEPMKALLHNVRLFGNETVHTTHTPKDTELITAWQGVNVLADAIYGTEDSNFHYSRR